MFPQEQHKIYQKRFFFSKIEINSKYLFSLVPRLVCMYICRIIVSTNQLFMHLSITCGEQCLKAVLRFLKSKFRTCLFEIFRKPSIIFQLKHNIFKIETTQIHRVRSLSRVDSRGRGHFPGLTFRHRSHDN